MKLNGKDLFVFLKGNKGDKGEKGDKGDNGGVDLGETEGTAYEGSKGAKNAQKIELLDKVVLQNGLYDILTITQEYHERVTANGENIVDGATVKLLKVEGNTQATRNLINPALTTGSVNYAIDGNSVVLTNAKGSVSSFYLHSVKNAKGTYTLSVKDIVGESSRRFLSIYKDGVVQQTITTFPAVVTITLDEDAEISLRSEVGVGDYATTTITELQIVEGEYTEDTMPEYTPYFDGLKSASFQGVVSKNADGSQESVLILPEPIECELGVTIDFENQKIVKQVEMIMPDGSIEQATTETPFTDEQKAVGNTYTAWEGGTERVIGGEYPELTLTQEYMELLGGASNED